MRTKLTALATVLLASFVFVSCTSPSEYVEEPNEVQEQVYEPTINEPIDPEYYEPESLAYKINALLTQNNFSGAIFVRQGEDVILSQAYGMVDRANNVENTIHTTFAIASITKQFTGAAILLLEEQGKLDTSSTFDTFFPNHTGLGLENVTVADLLAMQGGFGHTERHLLEIISSQEALFQIAEELFDSLSEEDFDIVSRKLLESDGDVLSLFIAIQALESVRTFIINYVETLYLTNWNGETLERFNYSNPEYWLLGRVIEEVSGVTYEEFIATNFFEPLGMTNSGFLGISESAPSYNWFGEVVPSLNIFYAAFATGGLVSSAYDLALWLDAYFSGELFDIDKLDEIFDGVYNYGWRFRNDATWWHGGSLNLIDIIAFVAHDRESDTTIIILSSEHTLRLRNAVRLISSWTLDFRPF